MLTQLGLGTRVALADPEPPPPPAQQAQVSSKDIPTGKVQQADATVAPQLQAIPPVKPVDPGPNGSGYKATFDNLDKLDGVRYCSSSAEGSIS